VTHFPVYFFPYFTTYLSPKWLEVGTALDPTDSNVKNDFSGKICFCDCFLYSAVVHSPHKRGAVYELLNLRFKILKRTSRFSEPLVFVKYSHEMQVITK